MLKCRHGTTIYCDWTECPYCVEEEAEYRRHDELMEVLKEISRRTSRESALEEEVRRLREEIEQLKRVR